MLSFPLTQRVAGDILGQILGIGVTRLGSDYFGGMSGWRERTHFAFHVRMWCDVTNLLRFSGSLVLQKIVRERASERARRDTNVETFAYGWGRAIDRRKGVKGKRAVWRRHAHLDCYRSLRHPCHCHSLFLNEEHATKPPDDARRGAVVDAQAEQTAAQVDHVPPAVTYS